MSRSNQDHEPPTRSDENRSSIKDRLLTYDEVSEEFSVPKGTLFWWVARRAIPHVRLGPRSVRFRRPDLEQWLQARVVRPLDGTATEEP